MAKPHLGPELGSLVTRSAAVHTMIPESDSVLEEALMTATRVETRQMKDGRQIMVTVISRRWASSWSSEEVTDDTGKTFEELIMCIIRFQWRENVSVTRERGNQKLKVFSSVEFCVIHRNLR